ncbi:MAG: hypothetical protein ABIG96_01510 [Candidatus Micrarchaeota archaeon]
MKKAVGVILILIAVVFLQYFGFTKPVILTSVPEFLLVLKEVQSGGADLAYFILTIGNFLMAIASIFLCFGTLWVAIDMLISKKEDFSLIVTRSPLVILSVGSGLFFGAMFAYVFFNLLRFVLVDAAIDVLLAIAALDFTLETLKFLESDARHFRFTVKLSKM